MYYDIVPGASDRLSAYAKTLPPVDCSDIGGGTLDMNMELFVGQLVGDLILAKEEKRLKAKLVKDLKMRIMFTTKVEKGLWEIKLKRGVTWEAVKANPVALAQMKAKRPYMDVLLNELPIEQAWELQKKNLILV